jgi:hypothetical protein
MSLEAYATAVDLPSKGLLYDGKIPEGKVWILPMSTREEKMMAGGKASRESYEFIDNLIRACVRVKDPVGAYAALPCDPSDLLIDDRVFLLIMIRVASYGPEYNWQTSCPECRRSFNGKTMLPADLNFKEFSADFSEPIPLVLPRSKVKVSLRLLRGKDEREISKYSRVYQNKIGGSGNSAYTYTIARHIAKLELPNGTSYDAEDKVGSAEIIAFAEDMLSMDSLALQQTVEENGCGTNMKLDTFCSNCDREIHIDMPFTEEFFRPKYGTARST